MSTWVILTIEIVMSSGVVVATRIVCDDEGSRGCGGRRTLGESGGYELVIGEKSGALRLREGRRVAMLAVA